MPGQLLTNGFCLAVGLAVWTVGATPALAAEPVTQPAAESVSESPPRGLRFDIKLLAIDANEGCDVADFNLDGIPDIVAGRNWYAGPDYTPRPVRSIADWNGYVESNGDFAYDVNQDGRPDVIAGTFLGTEVYWYENPGEEALKLGKTWPEHLLVDTQASQNEGQLMHDLDGDGVPEWVVNSWGRDKPLQAWKLTTETREVVEKRGGKNVTVSKTVPAMTSIVFGPVNGHGLGFGDLNGDGLEDILFEQGWYERVEDQPLKREWILHQDWNIHASIPILVADMNRDGRNDILIGLGHDYGLWWWEQLSPAADGKLQWKQHVIDNSFSQPHCLHLADLDGDGADELITGKRFYAHNGNDPGGREPVCLYYYKWDAERETFDRFTIDRGAAGTGLQIRTADLNADNRLDIVVAGKSGTYAIFNLGPDR